MKLDYVHRSRLSDLSPVVDVAWIGAARIFVGFSSGLIELIDVEERKLVTSFSLEQTTLLGLSPVNGSRILVQTTKQAGAVSLYQYDVWRCLWTVSTKTAASFAKPVVVSNTTACVVSHGQATLSLINLETGYVEKTVNICELVPVARGMIASLAVADVFFVLMESGHLISLTESGNVVHFFQIAFPSSESCVPTSLCVSGDKNSHIVGFSSGHLDTISLGNKPHQSHLLDVPGGVGAIVLCRDNVIAGSWKGQIVDSDGEIEDQPHYAGIVKLALDSSETRLAVGSLDGRVSLFFIDEVFFYSFFDFSFSIQSKGPYVVLLEIPSDLDRGACL